MKNHDENTKSPFTHRLGLFALGVLLAMLLVWLGDFVLDDIGDIPSKNPVVTTTPADLQQLLDRRGQIAEELRAREDERRYIEGSTREAQNTLNQLLKLQASRRAAASPGEQAMFQESQRLFLANQKQIQGLLQETMELRRRQRELDTKIQEKQRELSAARAPILRAHRRLLALYKLLFIAPFLVVGCLLFAKARGTHHAALVYAFDAAVLYLLFSIIYEHMPPAYYKYVFTAMGIVVVVAAMLFMIRQVTRPDARWLRQRRGDAYHAAQCPVCRYPIVGDDMRSVVPPKHLLKGRGPLVKPGATTFAYCCPGCGTQLFEPCAACGKLRHALLPHCLHCGAAKEA